MKLLPYKVCHVQPAALGKLAVTCFGVVALQAPCTCTQGFGVGAKELHLDHMAHWR